MKIITSKHKVCLLLDFAVFLFLISYMSGKVGLQLKFVCVSFHFMSLPVLMAGIDSEHEVTAKTTNTSAEKHQDAAADG